MRFLSLEIYGFQGAVELLHVGSLRLKYSMVGVKVSGEAVVSSNWAFWWIFINVLAAMLVKWHAAGDRERGRRGSAMWWRRKGHAASCPWVVITARPRSACGCVLPTAMTSGGTEWCFTIMKIVQVVVGVCGLVLFMLPLSSPIRGGQVSAISALTAWRGGGHRPVWKPVRWRRWQL